MAARSATAATCLSAPGSAAAAPSPAPSTALGTGNGPLRYRICVPCSKRPPVVRDAFSEAFGVKNRLLRYGRDIRCTKHASVVRDAFSKELGAKNSLLRYATHFQRCAKRHPVTPNAFSTARSARTVAAACVYCGGGAFFKKK